MPMLLLNDLDLEGKTVFLRVDLNVPLDENQQIRDDTRIRAVLPTLNYLQEQNARIVAASHLGRPKGKLVPELSLKPVAQRLAELLGCPVTIAPDVIGEEVDQLKSALRPGEIILLENLRYYAEETANDPGFARKMATGIDYFINDAFGACHRAHASVVAITEYVNKSAAGFLVSKEVEYLQMVTDSPQKPFTAILGGAKVSDKIPVIESLLGKADAILIGGAMAYTFFAAQGFATGKSLVEEDKKELALDLLVQAREKGMEFLLPVDHVVAGAITPEAKHEIFNSLPLPEAAMALDIGPATIEKYARNITKARTIFWNGPMGVFEIDQFAQGTIEIAQAVAQSPAMSIVGGGDSVAAIHKAGIMDNISHISTGGGASLEFIAHETLPGIEALSEK